MSESAESIRLRNKKLVFNRSRLTKQQSQDIAFMQGYLAGKRNEDGSRNRYQNERCFHAFMRGLEQGKFWRAANSALAEYAFSIDVAGVE